MFNVNETLIVLNSQVVMIKMMKDKNVLCLCLCILWTIYMFVKQAKRLLLLAKDGIVLLVVKLLGIL